MKCVLTVIGKDKPGMSAKVSNLLANYNVNIEDISQTIMQNTFTMIMLVSFENASVTMHELKKETDIFIYPGYKFKILDCLITNFHLPESTLVMLVSALAGRENVLAAYEEAVKERYRFFSFGDAMFVTNEE